MAERRAPAALPNVARKPVSGGVDLSSAEAIELRADDAIVVGEQLLPGGVSESLGGASGVDDVRHEEGRDDALVLARDGDRPDIAGNVHHDDRLIADDPGIVPGRDVEHVARPELGRFTIIHLDMEATRQQDLEMVDLA